MKKAMIYGAGISGRSVKRLFEEMKWETVLVDDKTGISSTDAVAYLEGIDLFIKSPGIPYNDLIKKIEKKGIKVVDEIEVAYNYMKKTSTTKVIAITGTNGKTTTTSKLAGLLNAAGIRSIAAGNIGTPYSEAVLEKNKYEYIVLELSSYQLENLYEFKADIAMIINLAPDHLDRYRDADEYYDTKFNVGMNQNSGDKFIVNIDDPEIMKRLDRIDGEILKLSLEENTDICLSENNLYFKDRKITPTDKFSLKGRHNLQNILFIAGAAKLIGIDNKVITNFLENTETLEHRMEEFYTYKNENNIIKFINDSKGTNLESTMKAIGAFEKPILICGGCDKNLELTPLIEEIKKSVKEVYLIGELAPKLEGELLAGNYPKEDIYTLKTLEKVVITLGEKIKNRDYEKDLTVLLSPASSSFDQFKNYEERGRIFKKLVLETFKEEN
ncbi:MULTISPECIES: UDP-N-acetylmuramoyl-L-alanine--D-glutamate ligase [Psychrilyobacter]|uniref:UDP-N-acetylmuramoylalanine--D-glutamate ligase n=1 Tax=Psychrilyobacter piezotolerans TaxID=2293438 RepID=A0ABX9KFG4_9FUSO|nr:MULTISPECIES: UDP-N-acetylmuramoyl-L-alanine--D-glutamate ligase [Psychrilyobacter]MCS5421556.1 UDP-N-acetylmuramoyl-L-alanine--D-glutamate ligase [Psychrilyobacter sp. S5]NDI78679.1 UDP-N-acetylmuramoyl-L-alanine--D-glutamate ligase [Psychrilyobacter piezotolerans]RDE60028.1 UDP-N-acetylmuramoyl-L-alanine--D-glutamate ligase [Psychrilyobacter sp. S5]REI40255.1 UDP-N-acetylmuramoyl-L-alanine--D-glutamate ligase [Psychrilyobacter piezotolerans]